VARLRIFVRTAFWGEPDWVRGVYGRRFRRLRRDVPLSEGGARTMCVGRGPTCAVRGTAVGAGRVYGEPGAFERGASGVGAR